MAVLKKIGQGVFTTAYRRNDGKVLLKSKDYIKECMAHGWFPSSRLFPKIVFKGQYEYVMNYYPKVRAPKATLTDRDYAFYKELRVIAAQYNSVGTDNHNELYKAFGGIKCKNNRRIMREALAACSNYGSDICFEISPRNISVSPVGRLVLMDCFFMRSQLRAIRKDQYSWT
jgi:hypothetical protein